MIPYKDFNYALTRIRNTIVMDEDEPVEVVSDLLDPATVDEYGLKLKYEETTAPVIVRDISRDNNDRQYISCVSKLVPSTPELGYVNYKGRAVYIARQPKRRDWRQGLRYHNMVSLTPGIGIENIPYSLIRDCLKNIYPNFDKCVAGFQRSKTLRAIAWAKDWALSREGDVFYQGEPVGKLIEGRVSLSNEYQYLQEALDESY